VLAAARQAGRQVIDEVGGKEVLRAYGIDVVREHVVTSPLAARAALDTLRWPVVAKLRSDALVHKARAGGVRMGLATVELACAAVDDLLALARRLGLEDADVVLQEPASRLRVIGRPVTNLERASSKHQERKG